METFRKLWVVADIHGCLDELEKLLEITDKHIAKKDAYVFLGDYIDRGPKSKQVVDLLIDRQKNHPNEHIFLRGNHEDFLLRDNGNWWHNGGRETLNSYDPDWMSKEFENVKSIVGEEHWNFYNNTKLYYKEGRTFCVHAGIRPDLCYKLQSDDVFLWDRRYVGYDGDYHENLFVVYGHTPKYEITQRKNQLGIDTAAVFGGKLTAACIDPETGEPVSFFQQKSNFSW